MPAKIALLPSGPLVACDIRGLDGNTLKLSAPCAFELRAPVKIESPTALWMGEVWVCEPDASAFYIEIEVSLVLHDPDSVETMAARFRHTPNTEETSPHLA